MFKLKNKDLNSVYALLFTLEIPTFKLNRKRGKFLDLLQEHFLGYYEKGKNELINEYSKKDDSGQPLQRVDDNGQNVIVLKDDSVQAFENEIEILDNEYYQLEINDMSKELLESIYEILSTDEIIGKLSGNNAVTHSMLCDELEKFVL